jgi:carbamoyl-phosphate synthase small subunit
LPANLRLTHRSLFDDTVQGLVRTDRPAFSFQGHPEASPGPRDLRHLFEHFIYLMIKRLQANSRGKNTIKPKTVES